MSEPASKKDKEKRNDEKGDLILVLLFCSLYILRCFYFSFFFCGLFGFSCLFFLPTKGRGGDIGTLTSTSCLLASLRFWLPPSLPTIFLPPFTASVPPRFPSHHCCAEIQNEMRRNGLILTYIPSFTTIASQSIFSSLSFLFSISACFLFFGAVGHISPVPLIYPFALLCPFFPFPFSKNMMHDDR